MTSQTAADALVHRILEIQSLMTTTIQHRADLLAQRPALEATAEEELLSPDGGGEALAALDAEIAADERRIEVIQATINRDRHSQELEKLALTLWDAAHAAHLNLTPTWSKAMAEVKMAIRVYLEKVRKLGKLAQAIRRQENLMNNGARPYIPGKEYTPNFDTGINALNRQGAIFLDDKVAEAFAPGYRPFTTNDALRMVNPEATDILKILMEEKHVQRRSYSIGNGIKPPTP